MAGEAEPEIQATPNAVQPVTLEYRGVVKQQMPLRAQKTFARHAAPLGDTSEWPLDDAQIETLRKAIRKSRTNASGWALNDDQIDTLRGALKHRYDVALAVLYTQALAVIASLPTLAAFSNSFDDPIKFLPLTMIGGTLTGVAFFSAHAMSRSRTWGAIALVTVFSAPSLLTLLWYLSLSNSEQRDVHVDLFLAALGVIGAILSFRAWSALLKFKMMPAWAQEIAILAK